MEKCKPSRRKSRPVSELITIFDHQQAEESKSEQWKSENALNLLKLPKTYDKEKPTTESNLFGNSVMSKSSDSVFNSDVSAEDHKKLARGEALGKTSIMLTLKPKTGTEMTEVSISSIEPKNKDKKSKENLGKKDDSPAMEVPKVLQEELQGNDKPEDDEEDEAVEDDESCSRRKYPLDDSLAVLRREMHSLRKQDVELMTQLLALNSSIQEFKSSSSSSSMSNFSDISDAETDVTEIEVRPSIAHAWHQRESSGSDVSDFESSAYERKSHANERRSRGRSSKHTSVNRDSMGSDISGYYSNPSPYGSNPSLNGYDVNGSDVIGDPSAQQVGHRRQKPWWNQNVTTDNGRSGSDPTLNRHFPENGGATLLPAVQSRAFFRGDERVKRISLQQKRISNRRSSAMEPHSLTTNLSRSESDQSISECDVSNQPISAGLQKWQRSRSSCALNSGHRASSPVQNTIKVDLRKNPPGTAIELVLPIQPLAPTRRSSAVRMAERKPLTRLNTLSKRQSMIW